MRRLGVHGPGSDIDTICVCPRHVYKEHFFGEFKEMLREWPAVTEISVCNTQTQSGRAIPDGVSVGGRVGFRTGDEDGDLWCRGGSIVCEGEPGGSWR